MGKLLIRLLLMALAFIAVLPRIPGISFHGTLFDALILSILFSIILWLVDWAAIALSAVVSIASLGTALLWLVPLWIFGFWLLPAVALKAVSDLMPGYISIVGWTPAVVGGLFMLVIALVSNVNFSRGRQHYLQQD